MTFLIDEDVPADLDRVLKLNGHDTVRVAEVLGSQTDDIDVWDHACRTNAVLITCNRQDFLELAGHSPGTGLLILNRRRTRHSECSHVLRVIRTAGESGLRGNINFA